MIYREYGTTGRRVSAIGFGGMRFADVTDEDASIELVLAAFEAGINYFDTAPGYCRDLSEVRVGQAVREMKRRGGGFHLATKSGKPGGDDVRRDLERSLERLGVDAIDFYHCWCVASLEDWRERKAGGAVKAILRAREEGLVRHACISTHLPGDEIGEVLGEGLFDGVLLGYSAINAPYRAAGIAAARERALGVAIMNPLGGGLIPTHADRFGFIRREGDPSLVRSALRFVLSTPGVSVAVVGAATPEEAREAAAAGDDFTALSAGEMGAIGRLVEKEFDELCTSCRYCNVCPEKIPVPKYMAAYNHRILKDEKAMKGYIKWHWDLENEAAKLAETCTQCRACEEHCTQHLPIVKRLEEIAVAHRPEAGA